MAWALHHSWGPVLRHAALALPDTSMIDEGTLRWEGPAPIVLHQGSSLSVVVDPASHRESALASDLTLSLESHGFAFNSLFGWFEVKYPPGRIPLARNEVTAAIAAWTFPVLAALGASIAVGLLITWAVLSTLYSLVLLLVSPLLGCWVRWGTAWRLAGASLLPGAMLMCGAVILYATRQLNWIGLLLAFPIHLVVGWIYCSGGLTRIAPSRSAITANPFTTEEEPLSTARRERSANPFQASSSNGP
jgi:hypothetical protein